MFWRSLIIRLLYDGPRTTWFWYLVTSLLIFSLGAAVIAGRNYEPDTLTGVAILSWPFMAFWKYKIR